MLSYFPEMYQDELLYSVIARYHKFSGNQIKAKSIYDLFEHSTMNHSIILPQYLGKLTEQTEKFGVKFDDLLKNRILFPFLTVFENDYCVSEITEWAFRGKKYFSKKNFDLWQDTSIDPCLKICPICLKEEQENFGEGYWHRLHQIPGVLVCPKHKTLLYDSFVACSKIYTDEFICPEDTSIFPPANQTAFEGDELDRYVQLANGIQWVFDNFEAVQMIWKKFAENYNEAYLQFLYEKNLV